MADDIYSHNLITNPCAETGDLTGWTSTGVTVVDGGTPSTDPNSSEGEPAPSAKCFQFEQIASLEQVVVLDKQPAGFLVSADFLPEIEGDSKATDVQAFVRVVCEYADGTTDIVIIPCRQVPKGR